MATGLDWHEARRLAGYVRTAGRTGLHRTDADRLMGGTVEARRTAFGLAYSKRWIDVCGQWIVLPANRQAPPKPASSSVPKAEAAPELFRPWGSGYRRT
jgi:hypothetical protein